MTGPDHYREAEASLAQAQATEGGSAGERWLLSDAAVHATLALAAATALRNGDGHLPPADYKAWYDAAGAGQSYGPAPTAAALGLGLPVRAQLGEN